MKSGIKAGRTATALIGLAALGATAAGLFALTGGRRADAQAGAPSLPTEGSTATAARRARGERVLNGLTGGKGLPPHFLRLRQDHPELADLTLQHALGDVWGREVLPPKTRQIAALAGFAAQGAMPEFKAHAQYALNLGVTPEEMMEVVYLTTVTSGYPRALAAAAALKELFRGYL